MRNFFLKSIKLYQKYLSFDTGLIKTLFPQYVFGVCRHHPTCSEYTYQAIEKYGIVAGFMKGLKRIVRCNPLNKQKLDPLE